MIDKDVRNRLFMTRKGRKVEATGFVQTLESEHYVEARDMETGLVQSYAKRHLRPCGYVHRERPLGALAAII